MSRWLFPLRGLQLALLNNPEACSKIAALYGQIQNVYEEERLRHQNMCCDLCGAKRCVSNVMGFAYDAMPNLCMSHGISWNVRYSRYGNGGYTTEYSFAKWLASQVLKEARKIKGETNVKDSTHSPRTEVMERAVCTKRGKPF